MQFYADRAFSPKIDYYDHPYSSLPFPQPEY